MTVGLRQEVRAEEIRAAVEGDPSAAAAAVRAVLPLHEVLAAPGGAPQSGCWTCRGAGRGVVDGREVHCCCGCPNCSCGQMLCTEGGLECPTLRAVGDVLGEHQKAHYGAAQIGHRGTKLFLAVVVLAGVWFLGGTLAEASLRRPAVLFVFVLMVASFFGVLYVADRREPQ